MKLEDIQKLCDEATEGPWTEKRILMLNGDPSFFSKVEGFYVDDDNNMEDCDARFIAAARELMPELLKVVKAAEYHASVCGIHDSDELQSFNQLLEALKDLEQV